MEKTLNDFENADEYIAYLEAEKSRLTNQINAGGSLRLKVSDKGAVSIYGLGRFPVTLYKSQMLRLMAHASQIVQFCKDNDEVLKTKAAA